MSKTPLFSISFADAIFDDSDWRFFFEKVLAFFKTVRGIDIELLNHDKIGSVPVSGPPDVFSSLRLIATALVSHDKKPESEALETVITKCLDKRVFGGLELENSAEPSN